MGLTDIASISITKSTVYPSRAGFGTVALFAVHSHWPERLRAFSGANILKELVTAGVTTDDVVYRMATKALQNPRVKKIVVAKRTRAYTQAFELRPKNTAEGYVYRFTVRTPDNVAHALTYTVLAAATTSTVATALAALIDALSNIVAAAVGPVITATTAAGLFAVYEDLPPIADLEILDTSADPGADDDLSDAEIEAQKSKSLSFYGIAFDHLGGAALTSAAAWVSARSLLLGARTSDSECAQPGVTTDVLSDLLATANERVFTVFSQKSTGDFREVALFGKQFPKEPGTSTFAFKTLLGVTPDNLTSGEEAAVYAKNGNTYTEINAINVTFPGITAGGEYIDVTRDLDFVGARIQEDVFAFKALAEKVAYTQEGIDSILAVVQARLNRCTQSTNPIFSLDVPPTVEEIKIADTESADRADRVLRGVTFQAQLAGAIHTTEITGTVTI